MLQWHVADVMTRDVISVGPDASFGDIVDALVGNGVSAVPVVDVSGHVVGVVSEADLLPRVEVADDAGRRLRRRRAFARKARALRAAELMTAPPITIAADEPVATAARKLDAAKVKRLPVVDAEGRLMGIVSRRDLLRMYTRPDPEIQRDVEEGVLLRSLWIDPATVDVRVVDGVVALHGTVETKSLAGLAVRLTAAVPGVVQVVDRLSWTRDDSHAGHGYAFGTPEQLVLPPRG